MGFILYTPHGATCIGNNNNYFRLVWLLGQLCVAQEKKKCKRATLLLKKGRRTKTSTRVKQNVITTRTLWGGGVAGDARGGAVVAWESTMQLLQQCCMCSESEG